MTTLHIHQKASGTLKHDIELALERPGQATLKAHAKIEFALTPQEQEDLRWYMEDYLQQAESVEEILVEQVEELMKQRGEELYNKVLDDNQSTRAIWFGVREQLADLRIEVATGVAEGAAIPWELMRDPESDSAIALRVQAFVRVQSDPNIAFIPVPPAADGRLRLLYVVSRPGGPNDVGLRAVANRLLQDLGPDLARFEITALRPPTFEQLQKELIDAKQAGCPFHIVHFDGHGIYADLSDTSLADWLKAINALTLGGKPKGKRGYLMFEHPGTTGNMRPVSGGELGKLLHDQGVPVLVLNACQSAMHEATGGPGNTPASDNAHGEVRAIGSLAQSVIDHGIPAVLGMRYSVFVVTAAQYIGQLYSALAKGRPFGEAASEGRKYLASNPDRWVGLQPSPLQDWFVPVVYEAYPIQLLPPRVITASLSLGGPELDPAQANPALRRYVPDTGFVGRDETLLLLDRAFDHNPIVLLHAYAGQGKSATSVEFARWYAKTGGLGTQPRVLFTSFERHTDLTDVLNQIGQTFTVNLQASGVEWHALNDNLARRRLVLQMLQQIPLLWIWDNVEPIAGFPTGTESAWSLTEQTELADFLKQIKIDKATHAKILLTSRRDEQAWLGGIPHRVEMPRMSRSDAAALARSLGNERKIAREEVADWQPLLDYCHGNPLTLRVLVGQAIRMKLDGQQAIANFVEAIRSGEQAIEDTDERQGRDKSLGASLDYGFRHAFQDDEIPVLALLHLFQGAVDVDALVYMGKGDSALPELSGKTKEHLASVLNRAEETGLLTQAGDTRYTLHPALPWFLRQLFARHYDGQADRSTAAAALRAWVEALGWLGDYYHNRFQGDNPDFIQFLASEEANLLHARRTARRHGWWRSVVSSMQGLRCLYDHQARQSEWSRLVVEITPDYCTVADEPIPGREADYSIVMGYRVALARGRNRDFRHAAALQEKRVAWNRLRAAPALALPPHVGLDSGQSNSIRSLIVSLFTLGQIIGEQGSPACLSFFEESILYARRIEDTAIEAAAHFNLGNAYKNIPSICNLDTAEAAYRRELDLLKLWDTSARAAATTHIGMIHQLRFSESLKRAESSEIARKYAKAAEQHYQQALEICPPTNLSQLGPIHAQTASLFSQVNAFDRAREHFEKAVQYYDQTENHFNAGRVRLDIAHMCLRAARLEHVTSRQHDLVYRAQAYAQAALRDFERYQGRAAEKEAEAHQLLEGIDRDIASRE